MQVNTKNKKSQKNKKKAREDARREHQNGARIKEKAVIIESDKLREINHVWMLGDGKAPEAIQAVQEVWDWVCIEAAVDTACVDNVANPKDFPGVPLFETEASKRGDSWTAAGGSPIPKLGELKIPWQTDGGTKHGMIAKAGNVGKTLISGDRLLEAGYAVILNKRNPRLVHETTKETIKLERKNRMFLMNMWVRLKVTKEADVSPVFTGQGKK